MNIKPRRHVVGQLNTNKSKANCGNLKKNIMPRYFAERVARLVQFHKEQMVVTVLQRTCSATWRQLLLVDIIITPFYL